MYIVDELGRRTHIGDENFPDTMRSRLHNEIYMYNDDTKLKKCWVAEVNKYNFPGFRKDDDYEYEYCNEKVFDHKPTEEELLFLLAKYHISRNGYVKVSEAYQIECEDDD